MKDNKLTKYHSWEQHYSLALTQKILELKCILIALKFGHEF